MPTPFQPDPDAACEACGAHGAFRFDGETLCADCYAGRGSCCSAEFSGRIEPAPACVASAPPAPSGPSHPASRDAKNPAPAGAG